MTIVVGYVPTPEGEAALTAAISEARLREQPLHVVNSSRGDSLSDPRYASDDAVDELRTRLDQTGLAYEVKQYVRGHAPGVFRISDIRSALPGVSDATIRNALDDLRSDGEVEVDGTGRSAAWSRRNAS